MGGLMEIIYVSPWADAKRLYWRRDFSMISDFILVSNCFRSTMLVNWDRVWVSLLFRCISRKATIRKPVTYLFRSFARFWRNCFSHCAILCTSIHTCLTRSLKLIVASYGLRTSMSMPAINLNATWNFISTVATINVRITFNETKMHEDSCFL